MCICSLPGVGILCLIIIMLSLILLLDVYVFGCANVVSVALCLVPDSSLKVSQVVKGEMSAKTTYQRSAKGPISIAECSADGKFISIENNGRRVSNVKQI